MPRKTPQTFDDLESNLSGALTPAPVLKEKLTRIMLEENENIPPTGQFISADGRAFVLRPGEEADVPECLLNVLDSAEQEVPILDAGKSVVGYRKKLRFPYRVITATRRA
jgi:hypothetical protein